jgi:putative transposase
MVEVTMNGLEEMRKLIEEGDVDLLRTMVKRMAEALMDAEVDALCGAARGERHPERVNRRNGYRERTWDTRSGTIDLALPKLRSGSYFPDWLLTPRKRSEQALVAAIADAYLAGVSTRRVDKLVRTLGIEGILKERGLPPGGLARRGRHGLPQPPPGGRLPVPCPRRPGGQGA